MKYDFISHILLLKIPLKRLQERIPLDSIGDNLRATIVWIGILLCTGLMVKARALENPGLAENKIYLDKIKE